jgi:hypothetical protein
MLSTRINYEKFLQEPGTNELLAAFPQIANDLQSGCRGASRLRHDDVDDGASKKISGNTGVSKAIIGVHQIAPAKAVGRALSWSHNPQRALQNYVNLIERSPR